MTDSAPPARAQALVEIINSRKATQVEQDLGFDLSHVKRCRKKGYGSVAVLARALGFYGDKIDLARSLIHMRPEEYAEGVQRRLAADAEQGPEAA